MPNKLDYDELKDRLSYQYTTSVLRDSRIKRQFNIEAFNSLAREGLSLGVREKRMCLHTTLCGEEISIQYPGKESAQSPPMEYDFRPKVKLANGDLLNDFTFGQIWDVFELIGKKNRDFLTFVSAIVCDMNYMQRYELTEDDYKCETIIWNNETEKIIDKKMIKFCWYKLALTDDEWYSLNDRFGGKIKLDNGQELSIEAFLFMVDLLFQNEDCKYYYKKVILEKSPYNLQNGRNQSSHSNLYMLNYLQGNVKVSSLVNAFQKGRGVASFRKQDYEIVTNGLIITIEGS